jgi:hypothetical protein
MLCHRQTLLLRPLHRVGLLGRTGAGGAAPAVRRAQAVLGLRAARQGAAPADWSPGSPKACEAQAVDEDRPAGGASA